MSYVNSVTVYPSSASVTKGKWHYGACDSIASHCPECAEVRWYSNSPSIASVNTTTGYIYGVNTGTTRIYAEATDGSGKKDYITVTVTAPIAATGISVCPTSLTMNVGDTDYLYETVYPSNATNRTVTWCSSDDSVAEVNTYTGFVRAKKAGIATITVCTVDGGYSASCVVTVNYCGGSNYGDVTKHNMVLQNDGYYVCTRCGYRVKSPELEDREILSTDDYLKIVATMHYYTQCKLLSEKNSLTSSYYNLQADNAQLLIDTIRSQSKYAYRYSYVNSLGAYHCNSTNNNTLSLIDIADINLLNIGVYNGVYESIASAVVAYYCPQVAALVDVLNLVTGQMNALDFGAFVAGMYEDVSDNMARYSKALTIASTILGMVTSEVSLEDRVVRINIDFRTSAHYIFDKNNKIKAVRIFYP